MENFPFKMMNRIINFGGLGFLIILISIYVGWTAYPYLLSQHIKYKITLNEGSPAMNNFYSPHTWQFCVYVYNITNPDEVIQGDLAIVEELGPYVYDRYRSNIDVIFTEEDTLSYKIANKFYFNANESGIYKESDIVTVLNVPLLEIAYLLKENFPEELMYLNSSVPDLFPQSQNLFMEVKVGDLFFNGVKIMCGNGTHFTKLICNKIRRNMFKSFREIADTEDFAFSYFHYENYSRSSTYKISRGNKNISNLGMIMEFDESRELKMWERNTKCSQIRGTDWNLFPPVYFENIKKIYLFTPEVCLSLKAHYTKTENNYGLPANIFMIDNENFDSPNDQEAYKCRCKKDKKNSTPKCTKKGIIDVTKCHGEPFVYGYPRLYHSDYRNDVIGYRPYPSKLESILVIEPRTGIALNIFKSLQKNIFLKKIDRLELLSNVTEVLFPLYWTDETYSKELREYYKNQVMKMKKIDELVTIICGVFIAVGVLILLASYAMYSKFGYKQRINSVLTLLGIERERKNGYF